jgi:hypothetical protein
MSGRPPLFSQYERPALLCSPDERREDVFAGLLAVLPVWAVAATLTRKRYPVDAAQLSA